MGHAFDAWNFGECGIEFLLELLGFVADASEMFPRECHHKGQEEVEDGTGFEQEDFVGFEQGYHRPEYRIGERGK